MMVTTFGRWQRYAGGLIAAVLLASGMVARGQLPLMMNLSDSPLIPGDRIRIVMLEDPSVTYFGEVSATGTIPVPYLGEFAIAGYKPEDSARALERELKKTLYKRATITVTLVKKGLGRVYIYGAVKQPGVVQIPDVGGLTVLQLITQIGGLSRWANPKEAFLLRRNAMDQPHQRIDLGLDEMFASAVPNTEKDVMLEANDIICIPGISGGLFDFLSVEDAEVYVVGEVKSDETLVYFAPGERRTLFRAILKAGGFSKFAKTDDVRIIRFSGENERQEMIVDASAIIEKGDLAKDVVLQQGDMVIVPQKRISF